MGAAQDTRTRELARIHCLKRDLDLSDETYRNLLWTIARVHSAKDLDSYGRQQVIAQLSGRSLPTPPTRRVKAASDRQPLIRKIEAMLAASGRERAYAAGICRQMRIPEQLEWCTSEQLRKVVAALTYDARRRASGHQP
ncbi:MAG TPA: regulatory protein GemA [Nevskiales bacterium]|nr:regulatory protein GemA [Nevskiales bacterium]